MTTQQKGKTMDITPEQALDVERRRLHETIETRAQLQLRADEVQPGLIKNLLEIGVTGLTETIFEIQESIHMLENYLSLPLTEF